MCRLLVKQVCSCYSVSWMCVCVCCCIDKFQNSVADDQGPIQESWWVYFGEFVIVVNRNEDFCYKISYTSLSCVCVRKRGREEKERERERERDRRTERDKEWEMEKKRRKSGKLCSSLLAGQVEYVNMMKGMDGRPNGSAYVLFASESDAQEAVSTLVLRKA